MNAGRAGWRAGLVLALLVYALGVFAYRDAIMDDTFIHLQYARNLRTHGELAFNPGEPSLGTTSPLWVLLLAAVGDGDTAARLASVACGALAVWAFAAFARRTLGAGAMAAAATVAWAANVWLVRHAPNGMESTAAALLVLLALLCRARGGERRGVMAGLVLGAAALVRPEAALVIAAFLVQDLASPAGRRRAREWVPICALIAAAWWTFAFARTGHFVPGTAGAKSGHGFALAAAAAVLWRELRFVVVAHAVEIAGIALWLGAQLRSGGRAALRRGLAHPLLPYVAAALGLGIAFAIVDVQVQPRYLLPFLPCVTLVGFAAWRACLGDRAPAAFGLGALALAASTAVSGARILPATRDYSRAFRPALGPIAAAIAPRGGERPVVATPDIGFLGWTSGARIVDLGGLIDPRLEAMRRRWGDDDSLLAAGAFLDLGPADFVVDRSRQRARFAGHATRGRHWREVVTTTIPNLGLSRPGPYYYTLYALDPETRTLRSP